MIDMIKHYLTLYGILPGILIIGGYLTIRLRFLQFTKIPLSLKLLTVKKKAGGMSSFSALSAVLGGNLGTGNISGIAIALATGGPGSLVWMWVMAFLAAIIKYAGCFLGVHYREKNSQNEVVGGPMFYLAKRVKSPLLAKLFCIFTILSALTVGNLVQVNSLMLPLQAYDINLLYPGIALALFVGGVIWGGMQRFAHVVSLVVPFMALAYIGCCCVILALNYDQIGSALMMILTSATGVSQVAGGVFGYSILLTIQSGFDRGLFATDAGVGLAPIIHGSVTDEPEGIDNSIAQGIISILSPLIVMIVCTMTGLVLIVTGAFQQGFESTNMCIQAFKQGLGFDGAGVIVSVTLFFFAYTTILTWLFCADRALDYLTGDDSKALLIFQAIFIALIPFGSLFSSTFVWHIADLSINSMFLINLIGIVSLCPLVIKKTREHFS